MSDKTEVSTLAEAARAAIVSIARFSAEQSTVKNWVSEKRQRRVAKRPKHVLDYRPDHIACGQNAAGSLLEINSN